MNIYEEMTSMAMGQMDTIMAEAKKYMLQPQEFDRYVGGFAQGASQIMQLVSNPAYLITDVEGNKHYMVAGERWKLVNFAMFQNEKAEMCFTNPITSSFEKATFTKAAIVEALQRYEEVYDSIIEKIMEINTTMNALQQASLCGDKYKYMEEVMEILNVSISWTRDYYNNAFGNKQAN